MDLNTIAKSKAGRPSLALILGLLLGGTAIAIVLALGFSQLILDACQGELRCQKPLLALFGGIVFTQALTVIACIALAGAHYRQSRAQLLQALRSQQAAQ